MYANKVKKIAAVHDLSGMGRVSLTVVIPILSSMGFQVCPLPTAVLSNHTQYPGFSFLDLTDEMPKIIAQWKKLEVEFDAIYTGYLGSPRQIQIVSDFIRDFRRPDSLIVADPVLGDNGRLYTNFDGEMIKEMRHLITKADVITPNLTELFYLLDKPYKADNTDEELKEYLKDYSDLSTEETDLIEHLFDMKMKGNLLITKKDLSGVDKKSEGYDEFMESLAELGFIFE